MPIVFDPKTKRHIVVGDNYDPGTVTPETPAAPAPKPQPQKPPLVKLQKIAPGEGATREGRPPLSGGVDDDSRRWVRTPKQHARSPDVVSLTVPARYRQLSFLLITTTFLCAGKVARRDHERDSAFTRCACESGSACKKLWRSRAARARSPAGAPQHV